MQYLCWAVAAAMMIFIGRFYHYHDSSGESFGRASARRLITLVAGVVMVGLFLWGILISSPHWSS